MDTNSLFKILYSSNENKNLSEKTCISYFINSKEIPLEQLKKISKKITYVIAQIPLSENESLLLEDRPQNFFLAHSILLGEKTKLVKANHKFSNKILYFEEKNLEKIREHILENSIKKITPNELFNKNIIWEHNQIPILKELVKYIKKEKNINLNAIHITKTHTLELFIPTIKKNHLEIAKNLSIPLKKLITNNFFEDSNINLFDIKTQIKSLKPLATYEKETKINVLKENPSQIAYKDLSEHIIIEYNIEEIKKSCLDAKELNFDPYPILKILSQKSYITIGLKNKEEKPLPLWRKNKLITFKDEKDFEEHSGVKYQENFEKLQNIYLQNQSAKQLIFKNASLHPKLKNTLKTPPLNSIISFITPKELLLSLILEPNPTTILKIETIPQTKITKLLKNITKLSETLILETIKSNLKPIQNQQTTTLKYYLESKIKTIEEIYQKYQKKPDKNNLINKILKKTNRLIKVLKIIKIQKEDTYNLQILIQKLLDISEIFEEEKSKEIIKQINEITPKINYNTQKINQNKSLEKYFESIPIIISKFKKKPIKILMKQELPTKHLDFIEKIEKAQLTLISLKPNIEELKKIAPYSYKEISKQITHSIIPPKTITINKKQFPLENKYYSKFYELHKYKLKITNEFFDLFEKEI